MEAVAISLGVSALQQPRLGVFGTTPWGPLGPSFDNPLVRPRKGQKIGDMNLQETQEGAPENRCLGPKNRVAGALVWMSDLREVKKTESGGGKGGSGGEFITYQYYAHLMVRSCRARTPISRIPKIWADGKVLSDVDTDAAISSNGIDTKVTSSIVYILVSGVSTPVGRNYMLLESDIALGSPDISVLRSGNTAVVSGYTGGSLPGSGNLQITAAPTVGAMSITVKAISGTVPLLADDVLEFPGFDVSYSVDTAGATVTTAGVAVPIKNVVTTIRPVASVAAPLAVVAKRGNQVNNGTFMVVSTTKDPDPSASQISQAKLMDARNHVRKFVAIAVGPTIVLDQANPTFKGSQVGEIVTLHGGPDQAVPEILEQIEGGAVSQVYAMRNRAGVLLRDLNITETGNRVPNIETLVEERADQCPVGDAIRTILVDDADWPEEGIDVSGVTGTLLGFTIRGPEPPRRSLMALMLAYDLVQWERGGVLYFASQANLEQITLPASEVGSWSGTQGKRGLEVDDPDRNLLPSEIHLTYRSPTKEYQSATKKGKRTEVVPVNILPLDLGDLVMDDDEAQQAADRQIALAWGAQRRLTAPLPQSRAGTVHEGMVVTFSGTLYGQSWKMLADRVDRGANMLVVASGMEYDANLHTQTQTTEGSLGLSASGNTQDQGGFSQPLADMMLLDLPPLRDEDRFEPGVYVAARSADAGRPWRGGILYWSRDDGVSWNRVADVPTEAVTGELVTAPTVSVVPGLWDTANTIRVRIRHPQVQLGSVSKDSCLAGANRFLVGAEIIGAANVVLVSRDPVDGSRDYDLSSLLRGLQDTEQEMETHEPGEAVVWLDGPGVQFLPLGYPHVGAPRLWRLAAHGGTVEDAIEQRFTPEARNCRPFHVEAEGTRDGSGNLTIKLYPTTRAAVDPFEQGQPLDEEFEAYEVDIVISGSVVRTLSVSDASEVEYSAADQATDGFAPSSPVTVRPYQLSAALLRGMESEYEV